MELEHKAYHLFFLLVKFLTPIDSTNIKIPYVELFKATFYPWTIKKHRKIFFETVLSSLF